MLAVKWPNKTAKVWATPALKFIWSWGITAAIARPPKVLTTIATITYKSIANGYSFFGLSISFAWVADASTPM